MVRLLALSTNYSYISLLFKILYILNLFHFHLYNYLKRIPVIRIKFPRIMQQFIILYKALFHALIQNATFPPTKMDICTTSEIISRS